MLDDGAQRDVRLRKLAVRARQNPGFYFGAPFVLLVVLGHYGLTHMKGGYFDVRRERGEMEKAIGDEMDERRRRSFVPGAAAAAGHSTNVPKHVPMRRGVADEAQAWKYDEQVTEDYAMVPVPSKQAQEKRPARAE
ncbi:hypothetical protein FVE85_1065 [Porphyridium purpureum]|uniref:Uncharacterized protein n=1 Tax=Porphyridium purpureum TaxID=35688 RepID=A0A5J4Z146_PORPP|nr:hypothetical protein FVE85_1065 [Porphyridium purpureum]|eukprot:POR4025..scf208_2